MWHSNKKSNQKSAVSRLSYGQNQRAAADVSIGCCFLEKCLKAGNFGLGLCLAQKERPNEKGMETVMKKLLIYLKDYKKESILAPLFKMLEASFELFVPLVMAAIVDVGIAGNDKGYILKMCLVMIVLGVIGLICSITAQFYAAKAAVGFATKLRRSLFAHIQKLSFSSMDEIGTSTMITRMTSDVNQVQSGVNLVLRLFLRSPFIVIGAMVMAFTIDRKAAMIFVVTIPLLSIVVFGIMLISIPLYRKVQGKLDRVLGLTRENLSGVRVIRAFHREEEEQETFVRENAALTRTQMFVGRISALMNPVTFVIVNGAVIVLIYTGALQVEAGILTQGAVLALVNYMSQILVELIKLANLIITVTKAVACAGRIGNILEMKTGMPVVRPEEDRPETEAAVKQMESAAMQSEPAAKQTEPAAKQTAGEAPIAEFRQACLSYRGSSEEALSDISFTVKRGETIGVIGGTGSGKTSLVNLLPRFYDVTKGSVLVEGMDVRDYEPDVLRRKIGMVMQKSILFSGTVRENLLWGNENATKEQLWEALDISQAQEFVEKKEGGLDAVVAQAGKNLSGGQKQRLNIARALVRKPDILILDDSASALDYATDARLRQAIRRMPESPAVFIVSQRAASIMHADKIIVLDDGKIAGMGEHEHLLKDCEVYQEIYYSQFPKEGGHYAG